ncbi:MAG TPA: YitT family protein [Candidatus Faecimonas gallistercoris]|nr:YitT family protein [Candidatus Faecimonas gallistercoris]
MDTFFENMINHIKKRNIIKRLFTLLLSLLVLSFVFNLLLLPTDLISGGVNGIAVITNYVYGIDPSIMIFLISLACLFFSLMYLGKERTAGSILATFIYPLFVKITAIITQNINIDYDDKFLIIIFAGVIGGLANGFIYKTGFSNGGLPIISQILYKYHKISIAKSSMIINSIIIIIGSIFFGWTTMMYAIILLSINNMMIDKVLLGISSNKAFYIVTTKAKEVNDYILNNLKHTVTIFNVKGAFLEKKRKILFSVIPKRDYYKLTEGIKLIDPEVFFVVEDAYEVKGGK